MQYNSRKGSTTLIPSRIIHGWLAKKGVHLNLHKLGPAMPSDVEQNVAVCIREQPLGSGRTRSVPVSQNSDDITECHIVVPVVHFEVVRV